MDINTDPDCRMDNTHTWLLAAALAQISPWHQVSVQASHIGIALFEAWPLDTNVVSGGWPEDPANHMPS